MLLDREVAWQHDKRLSTRLRFTNLRHQAGPEDFDYRSTPFRSASGIDACDNLAICGPTGIGKPWLTWVIGHKACRDNRSVLYARFPRLLKELALTRSDGRIASRSEEKAAPQTVGSNT
jgi:DNA replication protein DnaC